MKKYGLVKKDACDRMNWRGVVNTMIKQNVANYVDGEKPIKYEIDNNDH